MPALYPAFLKLQRRWLLSLTRITDQCQLIGIYSFAAYLSLQLFWVIPAFLKLQRRWLLSLTRITILGKTGILGVTAV
ncbi:hypothetical protein [Yersinia rohdei]|uniref:hypothetical protein n=1 Tax=Yersinia rohdei TaxID=29485 RepID=UPI00119DBC8C|nr:hypothetical protein [Yersinia rohdei]